MLTTKQKLDKILEKVNKISGESHLDEDLLQETIGYITAWLDNLPDED